MRIAQFTPPPEAGIQIELHDLPDRFQDHAVRPDQGFSAVFNARPALFTKPVAFTKHIGKQRVVHEVPLCGICGSSSQREGPAWSSLSMETKSHGYVSLVNDVSISI